MSDTAPSTTYLNVEEYRNREITDVHPADLNTLCNEIVSLRQQLALNHDLGQLEFVAATDMKITPGMVPPPDPDRPFLPLLRFEFLNPLGAACRPIHLIQNPLLLRDQRMAVSSAIETALKGIRKAG